MHTDEILLQIWWDSFEETTDHSHLLVELNNSFWTNLCSPIVYLKLLVIV